jgi:glucan phosphorylase
MLDSIASDNGLRRHVEQLVLSRRETCNSASWFEKTHSGSPLSSVAYFSMEFGLSEALPIYSGGLGNVAGDRLKAGSDLGVPIVGVGLLYQQGYFRQAIDHEGNQRDLFPYNPPSWLPITPVRDGNGNLLRLEINFPDYKLRLRVWEARVGRLRLYLLDRNDPANMPIHRGITSELYGGGPELRLQQELALGIGGWWAEAYTQDVGWSLGDGREHGDDPGWDAEEAGQLYDILENAIIARFYDRDSEGLPRRWIAMMRESMARLTPQFSANRTVREYTEKYYLPAAESFSTRSAAGGALASQIVSWQKAVAEHWSKLNFGQVNSETVGDFHNFRMQVFLGDLEPESVLVELYAQARDGELPMRQPMTRDEALVGSVGGFLYTRQVPSSRPAADYTPRIVPAFRDVRVPLELKEILWQR